MSTHAKEERRAELLVAIISHVSDSLVKTGIKEEQAYDIAVNLSDSLRHLFGGQMFYMPKGQELDTLIKHHQIFREFNGRNQEELSRKYNISVQHLYRVMKKLQKLRQPELFEGL